MANTITHGLGLVLFLIAIPVLLFKGWQLERPGILIGAGLFSLGLLKVYGFSTLYHAARDSTIKHRLRIMDHISIYWLIAGSYTPFVLHFVPPDRAVNFLMVMWGIVLAGTITKIFFTGKFDLISTLAYIALGWMGVFIFKDIIAMPPAILFFIAAGGISYTLGTIFYAWKRYTYHHAVWHVFVLAGSALHYVAVFMIL